MAVEHVAPFAPCQLSSLRPDDIHLDMYITSFYDSCVRGLPDVRKERGIDDKAIEMLSFLRNALSPVKNIKSKFVPPTSHVLVCKLSDSKWAVTVIIRTCVPTALIVSNSIWETFCRHSAISQKTMVLQIQTPDELHAVLNGAFVYDGIPIPPRIPLTVNCTVTQTALLACQSGGAFTTPTMVRHFCAETDLLSPYISLSNAKSANDFRSLALLCPDVAVAATQLAAFCDNGTLLTIDHTLLTMKLRDIIDMFKGDLLLPLSVSDEFINDGLVACGASPEAIRDTPFRHKLHFCINSELRPLGTNNTDILCKFPRSVARVPGTVSADWVNNMMYMRTFQRQIANNNWAAFPDALEAVFNQIVLHQTRETPKWVTAAWSELLIPSDPIPLLTNNIQDLAGLIANYHMPIVGDPYGIIYVWMHMDYQMITNFSWCKVDKSVKLFIECIGEKGCGKSHASITYRTLFRDLATRTSFELGTCKSWFVSEPDPDVAHEIAVFDDTKIGRDPTEDLRAAVKKILCGNTDIEATRVVKRFRPDGTTSSREHLLRMPAGIFICNIQAFNTDNQSDRAIRDRLVVQHVHPLNMITLMMKPTAVQIEASRVFIVRQMHLMQVLGLIHVAVGFRSSCLVADDIFRAGVSLLHHQSGGSIDLTTNTRQHSRYACNVDFEARQEFVNIWLTRGVLPGINQFVAIVLESLSRPASPVNCIAAFAFSAASFKLDHVPSFEHQLIPLLSDALSHNMKYSADGIFYTLTAGVDVALVYVLNILLRSNDGVTITNGVYMISNQLLRYAITTPTGCPNVFDAACIKLFTSNDLSGGAFFSLSSLFLHAATTSHRAIINIIHLYNRILPTHVIATSETLTVLESARKYAPTLTSIVTSGDKYMLRMVAAFTNVKYDFPAPAITPILQALCERMHVTEPFFVRVYENRQTDSRLNTIGGLYRFRPLARLVQPAVLVTVSLPGKESVTFPVDAATWRSDVLNTTDSCSARVHRNLYSLPNSPQQLSSLILAHECRENPTYQPIRSQPIGKVLVQNTTYQDFIDNLV